MFFNQLGLGPLATVVGTEIVPESQRGLAMGLATAGGGLVGAGSSYSALLLGDAVGYDRLFFGYAIANGLIALFVLCYIPETARRTLEQIQAQQAQPKGGSEGRIITSSGYVGTSPPRFDSDSAKEERLSYTKQLAAQAGSPRQSSSGGGGATPRTPTAREVRAELFAEDTGANSTAGARERASIHSAKPPTTLLNR